MHFCKQRSTNYCIALHHKSVARMCIPCIQSITQIICALDVFRSDVYTYQDVCVWTGSE